MSELPASHYLKIYERRVSMGERGVTHPTAKVLAEMKRLVESLRRLDPKERIVVEATPKYYIFRRHSNGVLVARIDFDEPGA